MKQLEPYLKLFPRQFVNKKKLSGKNKCDEKGKQKWFRISKGSKVNKQICGNQKVNTNQKGLFLCFYKLFLLSKRPIESEVLEV